MYVTLLLGLHPLSLFSVFALTGLLWGLQASIGANTGYRRDLEWLTGFLLGLVTSGILMAAFYSVRPISRTKQIEVPVWLVKIAQKPSLITAAAAVLLTCTMYVTSILAPVVVLTAPWQGYTVFGYVVACVALVTFICLGGYLGKSWFDRVDVPASHIELA